MEKLTLYLGNRNYSSWSLRPYLALKAAGAAFEEVIVPLDQPQTRELILRHSPSGRLPVLKHGETVVWDSLAICEYVAELFPEAKLWPTERAARALARSVCAEMHAGFLPLRGAMPMNVRRRAPASVLSAELSVEVERVEEIWADCRARYGQGGPFLFGQFTLADAMYAPVVSRFFTYSVEVGDIAHDYMKAVWAFPPMQEWARLAGEESWALPKYDAALPGVRK